MSSNMAMEKFDEKIMELNWRMVDFPACHVWLPEAMYIKRSIFGKNWMWRYMYIYINLSLSLSQLKIQHIVIHSNCVCFKCIIGNKCWYTWSIRVRQDDTIFYTDETGIYSKHYIKCGWIWVCPKNVAFTFKYILWFEERLELWATSPDF